MKLKTLLKTIDCDCVIYQGDYTRDLLGHYIGECHSYDKGGIFAQGEDSKERNEVESQIKELYDHNISKVYINTRGNLVIYVK